MNLCRSKQILSRMRCNRRRRPPECRGHDKLKENPDREKRLQNREKLKNTTRRDHSYKGSAPSGTCENHGHSCCEECEHEGPQHNLSVVLNSMASTTLGQILDA